MKCIPPIPCALAVLAGLLLGGCGGGGTTLTGPSAPASAKPVSLSGVVIEKDGETIDLAGIRLRLVEAGETAVTAADGSFAFSAPLAGTQTLRVEMPVLAAKNGADDPAGADDNGGQGTDDPAGTDDNGGQGADDPAGTDDNGGQGTDDPAGTDDNGGQGENEFEDDDADEREESSDDGVRIEGVQSGESVRVRIRIQDGQIVETRTSRSEGDEREIEIQMARAATSDDPDVRGEVELESRTDREKFETEVEHADAGRVLELFVIDPDGFEESQGTRTVDALGEVQWELATNDGARLPFGVAAVADLADHTVEVRDASTGLLLLSVVLTDMPTSAPGIDDGSGDDGTGSGSDDERLHGRARLTASEPGLEGYVEVRRRVDENRDRFKIEAEHLAPGRVVEFFVEDPGMAGSLLSLGLFAADASGEAQVELDTHDGDLLPGNVDTVEDLVGLAVEVRDGSSGDLLLDGTVPAPVLDD